MENSTEGSATRPQHSEHEGSWTSCVCPALFAAVHCLHGSDAVTDLN